MRARVLIIVCLGVLLAGALPALGATRAGATPSFHRRANALCRAFYRQTAIDIFSLAGSLGNHPTFAQERGVAVRLYAELSRASLRTDRQLLALRLSAQLEPGWRQAIHADQAGVAIPRSRPRSHRCWRSGFTI